MRQSAGRRIHMAAAVFACLLGQGAAKAADAPTRAPVIQLVLDCRKIDDSAQRLACYDKAADGVAKAEASGDLVTIDREQRRAVRHQAFGLNLPSLAMFDRGDKAEETDRISAKIVAVSKNAKDAWVITLEGGAVWVQIDDTTIYPEPHPGSTATVRSASLGSFFMTIDGRHAFRAHREN